MVEVAAWSFELGKGGEEKDEEKEEETEEVFDERRKGTGSD